MMVTRRTGARGDGYVFVRREMHNTARRDRPAPLSVAYGTMARMRGSEPPEPPQLPDYAERVLEVAEQIPSGRVMTYGDVAEWLGEGGPRQVGRVMALYGGAVRWWRVVRADGVLLPGSELRALGHYREESTPLRDAARSADDHIPRLDMRRARWDGAPAPEPVGGPADEPPVG